MIYDVDLPRTEPLIYLCRAGQTLSVTIVGTGDGAVRSSPIGIDCAATCNAIFPQGTQVTLTATPTASSHFSGWNGDADCADGSVTMDGAKSCAATFDSSMFLVYLPIVVR